MRRRKLTDWAGETLLEAVIAISVLMIIIGPASALYVDSMRTTADNRSDLIAAALTEEGVEIMRNIRDTNFLRFSDRAEACWNVEPETPDTADCADSSVKIGDPSAFAISQKFILKFDFTEFDWRLESDSTDLNLATDPTGAVQYKLRLDNSLDGSTSCGVPVDVPCTGMYFTPVIGFESRGVESRFYRQISVEYLSVRVSPSQPAMRIVSKVQYRKGSSVNTITRTLILTNRK